MTCISDLLKFLCHLKIIEQKLLPDLSFSKTNTSIYNYFSLYKPFIAHNIIGWGQ